MGVNMLREASAISHGTTQELDFVDGMGGWSSKESHGFARLQLLQAYLAAMPLRTVWGYIDPVNVRHVVLQLIKKEERL